MKAIDLYINAETGRLVNKEGHDANIIPSWHRGDAFLLRVHYLDVSAPGQEGGVLPHALPPDSSWRFGGKKQAGPDVFLFESGADKWNIPGDWEDADPEQGQLSVRVNLNTPNLTTLLAGGESETVKVEIEETSAGGHPFSIQFEARIIGDVIRGTEGLPEDPQPTYLTVAEAYAKFQLAAEVYKTWVVHTATDQLVYTLPIDWVPGQIIYSVRRPSGGGTALDVNWRVNLLGEIEIVLNAFPPAGTKIYVSPIPQETVDEQADPTYVIEADPGELLYTVPVVDEPSQVIISVRRPEGGVTALGADWRMDTEGDVTIALNAFPPAGTKIYVTIIKGELIDEESD